MAFPGMTPPGGGMPGGPGNNMQGMNDQEQAIVKTVSRQPVTLSMATNSTDAIRDGILSHQDRDRGDNGVRAWGCIWSIHGQCKPCSRVHVQPTRQLT